MYLFDTTFLKKHDLIRTDEIFIFEKFTLDNKSMKEFEFLNAYYSLKLKHNLQVNVPKDGLSFGTLSLFC